MKGKKPARPVREVSLEWEGETFSAIYQLMTGALSIVRKSVWDAVIQNPDENPSYSRTLSKLGILLDEKTDEDILYRSWRQQSVHGMKHITSHTTVTRFCNLACSYCILEHEPKRMNRKTAWRVDRFYTDFIKANKPNRVTDVYSGGEVFLNACLVAESAGRRCLFCKGMDVDYRFWVITNGTLLKPSAIESLMEAGLAGIRVSVAGPAWIHDKLRSFVKGGGTYGAIMKNLVMISGLVPIKIETQYDPASDDYLHIPEMLDDMKARGVAVENVSFSPIVAGRGGTGYQCGLGDGEKLLYLIREAEKRGYPQFDRPPGNACAVDRKSHLVFETDGSLAACPALQSGEYQYGHVADGGVDFVARSALLERKFDDRCSSCWLLCRCGGGCRMNNLSKGKDFSSVDCHYDILASIMDEYIRRRAVRELNAAKQARAA